MSLPALLLCTTVLGGCSINPAPADVSRSTPEVVEHLLVETRLAIIEEARRRLLASHEDQEIKLADELQCDASYYKNYKPTVLSPKGRDFNYRYINVAIALDFVLDSSESNNASTTVDFLRMVTNGSASLEVTAVNNLTRDSIRSFLVSRTFENLLTDERLAQSCGTFSPTPNFQYPISGSVGIIDVIDTFIELNEDYTLKSRKDSPNVYADKLTFTTTVTGSVVPKIVLSPPTRAFHLTMAALNAAVSRIDLNMLSIGLAFPQPSKPASPRARRVGSIPAISALAPQTTFARSGTNTTEDAAINAIQQQRSNLFLDRIGTLPLR